MPRTFYSTLVVTELFVHMARQHDTLHQRGGVPRYNTLLSEKGSTHSKEVPWQSHTARACQNTSAASIPCQCMIPRPGQPAAPEAPSGVRCNTPAANEQQPVLHATLCLECVRAAACAWCTLIRNCGPHNSITPCVELSQTLDQPCCCTACLQGLPLDLAARELYELRVVSTRMKN